MIFTCGDCHKCEERFYGSFFPNEEWKLKYFGNSVFQREDVWFLGECPYYKDGKCTVHEESWRPIQCQIYPCYLDYDGSIHIDWEGCPNAHLVDRDFLSNTERLIMNLGLTKRVLRKWWEVVTKYCEVKADNSLKLRGLPQERIKS